MMFPKILLRSEYRIERRTPLTPKDAQKLIENHIIVYVEKSNMRIYSIEEYFQIGCIIIDEGSWIDFADENTLILGLKELPESILTTIRATEELYNFAHFQHCLKNQIDSRQTLRNLAYCNLYDFEYVTLPKTSTRLLAFGEEAGFVGAALAMMNWITTHDPYESITFGEFKEDIIFELKEKLRSLPKIIIIGANGRCGKGARELFAQVGATNVTKWDIAETQKPGPYVELLDYDILINSILLQEDAIPNVFLTEELIRREKRLKIIVDVSCNVLSKNNVLPFCDTYTTFDAPFITKHGINVCTIDNLPSLIPFDASVNFSKQLTLLLLSNTAMIWKNCLSVFKKKLADLKNV